MWLIGVALASECTLNAQVDDQGGLDFVDRGDCPPHLALSLRNSVGQDEPLDLPPLTRVELPVDLQGRAGFVAPASSGRVVETIQRHGPDLSHALERAPELPEDCELLVSITADGRVDAASALSCPVGDYDRAVRAVRRARFAASPIGGHARLPAADAVADQSM